MKAKVIIKALSPLFVIQFFTWLGLFSLWIYAVPVVSQYIFYNIKNHHPDFEKATFWVGIYFALYSILGASFVFYLHKILKKNNKFKVHAIALLIGGVGLASIYFIHSPYMLLLSFVFIGIGWSSISTVPYLMVGEIADESDNPEKYYSIFNFSTVIPQAVAAFLLAYLTSHFFSGQTNKTILLGGIFMMLAGLISWSLAYRAK